MVAVSEKFKNSYLETDKHKNSFVDNSDFITFNGLKFKKNDPLFKMYKEALTKKKEEIEKFSEQGDKFQAEQSSWRAKVKDYLAQLGLYQKGDKEYEMYKDLYWNARFSATAFGNKAFSSYLSAFLVASDTSNFLA